MKDISVIGVGYVGLVTSACFADLGNRVVALDIDEGRIAGLRKGEMPIYEPGLKEVVSRNVAAGRLRFTTSYAEALQKTDFVFIAVGTPASVDGEADLQYVRSAAESVAQTSVQLNEAATQTGAATQQVATTIQQVAAGAGPALPSPRPTNPIPEGGATAVCTSAESGRAPGKAEEPVESSPLAAVDRPFSPDDPREAHLAQGPGRAMIGPPPDGRWLRLERWRLKPSLAARRRSRAASDDFHLLLLFWPPKLVEIDNSCL